MAKVVRDLIKKLENRNGWYAFSFHIPEDFLKTDFVPFLRIIDKHPAFKFKDEGNPNQKVALSIRKLIHAIVIKEKKKEELQDSSTSSVNN